MDRDDYWEFLDGVGEFLLELPWMAFEKIMLFLIILSFITPIGWILFYWKRRERRKAFRNSLYNINELPDRICKFFQKLRSVSDEERKQP